MAFIAAESSTEQANKGIARMIEAEALQLGLEAFFQRHVRSWADPKRDKDLRSFAKEATRDLPDYCSFDAFFAKFEYRFAAWYETGNFEGIAEDPDEE